MSLFIFFGMAFLVILVSTVYLSVTFYHYFTHAQFWLDYKARKARKSLSGERPG
jgi:hypothetical protein